ncbi:MAG: hypothetical protein U5J98_06930 [Halobacteriales archaeon]|nr:hypothetical protein [Halobacteriales archaeon]
MVVGEERSRWRPDPMPFEQAARVREMFEARMLLPACNAAYNDLRLVAGGVHRRR